MTIYSIIKKTISVLFLPILFIICHIMTSCGSDSQYAVYNIDSMNNSELYIPLNEWTIWMHEDYKPLYNQIDLKELYNIESQDTMYAQKGKPHYLYCILNAKKTCQLYVELKSAMPTSLQLNGDSIRRKDIQGLSFYPLNLKKGENSLIVTCVPEGDDLSFEAFLCSEKTMCRLFAEEQTGNIIYPLIYDNTIMLTNSFSNITEQPIRLSFFDVKGTKVEEVVLQKDSLEYKIEHLEKDVSYMCCITIGSTTIHQPVLCGKDDDSFPKFRNLRKQINDNHPKSAEIDQLLYRLSFLLNHPSRYEGDWWWQFKIPFVTYQLEYTFAHLKSNNNLQGQPNIQFVTYISSIDSTLQRYLLALPNSIKNGKQYPLVVITRPCNENKHHFFSSPQLARQWAINHLQSLANRYDFIVAMPEARMNQNEELTPKAEKEIKLAIEDISKKYSINRKQIFLHANCSGGYRALQMATRNPKMFAAIGLYAPLYHRPQNSKWLKGYEPEKEIKKIKDISLYIQGDPYDKHSPIDLYHDLVCDCKKNNIDYSFFLKRNSGKLYNVTLVGEEALEYFSKIN